MLTSYPDEEAVLSAIIAGASGDLLKQIRGRDLVDALEAVGRGESLLDSAVTKKVLERVRRMASEQRPMNCRISSPRSSKSCCSLRRGRRTRRSRPTCSLRQEGEKGCQQHPVEGEPPAPRPGSGLRGQATWRPPTRASRLPTRPPDPAHLAASARALGREVKERSVSHLA